MITGNVSLLKDAQVEDPRGVGSKMTAVCFPIIPGIILFISPLSEFPGNMVAWSQAA